MKTIFDESWKGWIKTNVNDGQDKNGIFKILLDEGYEYQAICREMNYQPSISPDQLVNPFGDKKKTQATSNKGIVIDRSKLFIPNAKKLESAQLELYTLDDFLDQDECEKLIVRIKSNLKASTLSSYEADQSYRTSRTCNLAKINDEFVRGIHSRICRIVGIDPAYSEEIQGQYYEVGQEFKAHTDYFEPHEMKTHASKMGQRTYTFMIYLNEVEKGGATDFIHVKESFTPKTGMAVIWSSLNSDGTPNGDSMHQARPVEKGYKAVITCWFRSSAGVNNAPAMFTKEKNEYIPNYTRAGFLKTQLPNNLFVKITQFYQENKLSSKDEHVDGDFIYNKVRGNKSSVLIDLSDALRKEIHDVMKPKMEKWCTKSLEPTYVYGIREYKNKAILKTHRDRFDTHIISAIINVDQKVNQDWPLVIEDNDYRTHHVILKPGDVVFYEGGRLKHGRPYAFDGDSFANIFCHFKPENYIPINLA